MALLIDTSLWVDFFRPRSSRALKRFIAPLLGDPDAHLAEPITFEILRHATHVEHRQIVQQFSTYPLLTTPPDLWMSAALLGQACRRKSYTIGSIDLLIAAIAIHHDAELITFDQDFQRLAIISSLRVKTLTRPKI